MNLEKSQNRIRELMSKFVTEIRSAKAMNRTDINTISENVLIPLFSEIYGYSNLKNLNASENINFPGIDLGDEGTRIAYQITATSGLKKIKRTLEKFISHKLYDKFDQLIIYILTEKQKTYKDEGLQKIIQGKFSFDTRTDIRDYRDLLKEISGFSLEKSRSVEKILEQHFVEEKESIFQDTPQDILEWLEEANQRMDRLSGDENLVMKIDRERLLNDLHNFTSQGSGVIIGSPGIGKTYLLKELRRSLKSVETPHLRLPIDQLGDGTEGDLQRELLYKGDLIEKLKSVPKKAILLFDAFDAARNEDTRKYFLRLIRRAIQELNGQWNVIVTVRTYDAMRSRELLDLFVNPPDADLTQYHSKGILCRHFTIPLLNEDETRQAFNQIPHIEPIYESGSQDFKYLLANPFNLWLLERILRASQDIPDFSQIRSEVQLLGLFWQRRIEATSNEEHRRFVLKQVAHQMVKERSLTVRRDNIYDSLHLDKPARQTAWDNLLSDEIVTKVSSTKQRVAFSHNILFDYAISVLLIEDDPQLLENFVLEDSSRPLFLRPSLTYFFTRLWYDAPENFWNAFWHILPSNQSVHLRLFARLIPTSVIANEARNIDELEPLLEKLRNGKAVANEAITRLLQSHRALQIKRDALWSNFFDQVSIHLHIDFAWDLAILTSYILERAAKTDDTSIIDTCGRVGRRLLEWVWQGRETSDYDWYNRLGSSWAVPLVAKTYDTNVEESRRLLEKVLELTQEDNFPIRFLTWLTEHVDEIWDHDSEFVSLIYETIFTYQEISDEKTDLNAGSILSLRSNRRQDYGNCQYRLIRHFPSFLQANSPVATQVVIRSLNSFIISAHIVKALREGVELNDLIETFNFREKSTSFLPDMSYIWDQGGSSDQSIKMAHDLFKFIADLAKSENSSPLLNSLLDVFRDTVEVAFFWRHLLKVAAQFPEVFAPHLFELCVAKPIQMGNETFHELSLFLQAAVLEFTPEQLLQIEEAILALPREATDKDDPKLLERRRNLFLAQIPLNLLKTDEAREILEKMERENDIPENRPLVRFSTHSESYSQEEWLQDQGVDTTTPENEELQRFFKTLDKFTSDWLNDEPTEEAAESIISSLQKVYDALNSDTKADKEIIELLWNKLISCVAILSRVADNPERDFCRQVLLHGAIHELPKLDPQRDTELDTLVYSPYPRDEAARGLLRLVAHQSDAEILDKIEDLARDHVPSVRMATAMELFLVHCKAPERFWHIVEVIATHETAWGVQEFLYYTLIRVVAKEKENEYKTTRVMDKLLKRTLSFSKKLNSSTSFIALLMWLAISRDNSWALNTIKEHFFSYSIQYSTPLGSAVLQVMSDYVVLKNIETPDRREILQRAIKWLEQAINVASGGIQELCTTVNGHWTEEANEKLEDLYKTIDGIIMRLYFEIAYEKDQSDEPEQKISNELRRDFYDAVKPLMKQIIDFALDKENGVMFAQTAHHFMQLLTGFLSCNPKEVLHLAEGVARSSEPFGYNLDSLAVDDVVKLVESVLADHRSEVRDGEGLKDLLNLLDIFAKTGWSDAQRLVWRLDEVFR